MKVLFYNWIDFEDPRKRGGGVSIYQRNLIEAAAASGDQVYFLSSGVAYNLFRNKPYIRSVRAKDHRTIKFEIVNSPFLSPAHLSFQDDLSRSEAMEALFAEFLANHGPFDAIHFNNLEGIPQTFVALAKQHAPRTKVLFSLHNYFPFCPEVNLWFQAKENCVDFADGKKCVNCLSHGPNPATAKKKYQIATMLASVGIQGETRIFNLGKQIAVHVARPIYRAVKQAAPFLSSGKGPKGSSPLVILNPAGADRFARRRASYVETLNRHCDHVLAVSERVAELAIRFGIEPGKVATAYIGTKFAQASVHAERRPWNPNHPLSIAYLGYMRQDKGFYFFLKALRNMPEELAARLNITIAAKLTDSRAVEQLKRTAHKFAAVTLHDGYTHATLPQILATVNLGIVPVLWEDNLPQVAIEMVGSGVPILTSDLGGACELLNTPELTFKAGSQRNFYAKLKGVLETPEILERAMAGRRKLYTTDEHYRLLREHFYASQTPQVAQPLRRSA